MENKAESPQKLSETVSAIQPNPPLQTPPEPKHSSFLTSKLFLITLAIVVLFTIFYAGIYLNLNSQLNQITKRNQTSQIVPLSPSPTPLPSETSVKEGDPTANWKTYTNTKFGYSLKYPESWSLKEEKEIESGEYFTDIIAPGYEYQKGSFQVYSINIRLNNHFDPSTDRFIKKEMINNYQVFRWTGEQGYVNDSVYFKIKNNQYISVAFEPYDIKNPHPNQNDAHQIFDQILSTLKFTDQDNIVTIDFSICQPIRQRVDVGFGSTTFEIKGKSGNMCLLDYGGEVENPNWNGKLSTHCKIPIELGKVEFQKTNYGVDFTPIKQYCSS